MSVFSGMVAALLLLCWHDTARGNDGQLQFLTGNADTNFGLVYLADGETLADTNFYGALLGSTTGTNGWTLISPVIKFTEHLGAGTGVLNDGTPTVSGVNPGTTYYYELMVWSTSAGTNGITSYNLALATPGDQSGMSAIESLVLGGSLGKNNWPVEQANMFPNFNLILSEVPEPATLALMGLGGLSLFLFRRKNS